MFLIENECKIPYGSLTFIFYQKYFYDKMDLQLCYFHVMKYPNKTINTKESSAHFGSNIKPI